MILYYVLRYSLQWWCGIYLGPVWSKALCLGWHTGIVSWCLSMPAFHATTCWALGTSRHTHTWMIRENLNWFIFKFLKIPICNTSIEKDYVILLIVVYEVEQNFYSNGTLSRTNCVCVHLVPLLVPSFRLIPGFYVSPPLWMLVPTLYICPQHLL